MSELKPCPFCGGKAIGAPSCRPEWVYEIKCTDCGAKIKKLAICPSCARREAIEAWNARYERTCQIVKEKSIELTEYGSIVGCLTVCNLSCGHVTFCANWKPERPKHCSECGAKVVE